jgi:hypothetical protein
VSGEEILILGIAAICLIGVLIAFMIPIPWVASINFACVGANNTLIYVITIWPQYTVFWVMHKAVAVYNVNAYAGNTAVGCIVEQRLPIIITSEGPYHIVLKCPTAITRVVITASIGTQQIIVPIPVS